MVFLMDVLNFKNLSPAQFLDLVWKTTRVATRHNTTEHKTTRVQHNTTRDSTGTTRDNTSTTRDSMSIKQHKIYFDFVCCNCVSIFLFIEKILIVSFFRFETFYEKVFE